MGPRISHLGFQTQFMRAPTGHQPHPEESPHSQRKQDPALYMTAPQLGHDGASPKSSKSVMLCSRVAVFSGGTGWRVTGRLNMDNCSPLRKRSSSQRKM